MIRFYSTPMPKRIADAERYWRDEEYRLRKVNAVRARRGQPLAASVDEIGRRAKA